MKPSSGESAPEAIMSRSDTSRDVSVTTSRPSTSPGRGPATLLFGDTDLARTLMVVGAIPLGAWGVFRAVRPLARSALPALTAAVAYAVNPLPRNAIAQGRLGSLVLYALAPFFFTALLHAVGIDAIGDEPATGRERRPTARRPLLALSLGTALVAAFFWVGLWFALMVGVAFLAAAPFVGGARFAARVTVTALVATAGAAVLLVPWTFAWFERDGASLGLVARE